MFLTGATDAKDKIELALVSLADDSLKIGVGYVEGEDPHGSDGDTVTLNVKCPNSAGELVTLTHDVTFRAS